MAMTNILVVHKIYQALARLCSALTNNKYDGKKFSVLHELKATILNSNNFDVCRDSSYLQSVRAHKKTANIISK